MGTIFIVLGGLLIIAGIVLKAILHFHPLKYKAKKKTSETESRDEYTAHEENARTTAAEIRHKTVKMDRKDQRKTSRLKN